MSSMILLTPPVLWIASGLVLLVLEMAAPGAFMVWIGLAAIGTGLATEAFPLTFAQQVGCFAVLAAITIAIGLRLRHAQRRRPSINTATAGLVGRTAHALAFEGREGRVRLGDSDWPARLVSRDETAPSGPLEVVGTDGMVLLVRPQQAPSHG